LQLSLVKRKIGTATTEEIKKDVEDLANIVIEDKIPVNEISMIYQQSAQGGPQNIEPHLKHTIIVSDIIVGNIISRRFVDKVLFLFGKYVTTLQFGGSV
jgi:hypothetical protein